MGERGQQIFVDASGRRKRIARYAATGAGAALACFLLALTAGLFDSGPSGSSLPWIKEQATRVPAEANASPSARSTHRPGPTATPGADAAPPSAPAGTTTTGSPKDTATASDSPDAPAATSSTTARSTFPARGQGIGNGNGTATTAVGRGKNK